MGRSCSAIDMFQLTLDHTGGFIGKRSGALFLWLIDCNTCPSCCYSPGVYVIGWYNASFCEVKTKAQEIGSAGRKSVLADGKEPC